MLKYYKFSILFFFMWEKKEILILLQKSKLFTDRIKQQVEAYINNMNERQLVAIHQALITEKTLLLQFLKTLKNSWDLPYEEIKAVKESISRKQRQQLEQSENENSEESLNNLHLSLDNL